MVTEQFDMSDELRSRGDMWEVSASWSATCVLLSAGEVPSIYVDLQRGICAIFDQIEAEFDAKNRSLHVMNPTPYTASVRVQKSSGKDLHLVLDPGTQRTVAIDGKRV